MTHTRPYIALYDVTREQGTLVAPRLLAEKERWQGEIERRGKIDSSAT